MLLLEGHAMHQVSIYTPDPHKGSANYLQMITNKAMKPPKKLLSPRVGPFVSARTFTILLVQRRGLRQDFGSEQYILLRLVTPKITKK